MLFCLKYNNFNQINPSMKPSLLLLLGLWLPFISLSGQIKTASALLSEAIYEEEVSGNLEKASELYLDILKKYPNDRPIAAKTLYHLGLVNEKLGKQQADEYYLRLINSYPDQKVEVALARARLKKPDEKNVFRDSRDGHKYRYVTIGTQTWMAENLAYLPFVRTSLIISASLPLFYVYDYEENNASEAKASYNYNTYGVLYNWAAAKRVCPTGWHLPGNEEWAVLSEFLGPRAGIKMKSNAMWANKGFGDNSTGFSALPGGSSGWMGWFGWLGVNAYFWTATEIDSLYSWCRILYWNKDDLYQYKADMRHGMSVRCLKDSINAVPTGSIAMYPPIDSTLAIIMPDTSAATNAETSAGDFEVLSDSGCDGRITDERDGHEYMYKTIGTQTWLAENLAYMPSVSPSLNGSEFDPFYYVYGYEGNRVDEAKATANYKTYGVLFNWEAAQKACPAGWHLPSEPEWNTLVDSLWTSTGGKMKETGTKHWLAPNAGATNQSGFKALPGGWRNPAGKFLNLGKFAYFWSSWHGGPSSAWYRMLWNRSDNSARNILNRSYGLSIRCIRN